MKKSYSTPKLAKLGDIGQVTQSTGSSNGSICICTGGGKN